MFTKDELMEHLYDGAEGRLQLPYDEACLVQKILISHGYVVLMSDGDMGGNYKIEWIYAGDSGNLEYANSNSVVFANKDWLEMLDFGDYVDNIEENEEEE